MPSTLSDVYKSHPLQNHNSDQYLDLNSVNELPDSHAWESELDGYSLGCPEEGRHGLPVIDLGDPINAPSLVAHACKTWGAFQIKNHGVSTQLVQRMEEAGKRLFCLPVQQKMKAARAANGASGYGSARISSFFPKQMWSEGFTIVGSPLQHARALWPHNYLDFCDAAEEYQKEMKNLAGKLTWILLESLGINKEDIEWADPNGELKGTEAALQLNSYPVCPDPVRAMGLAEHTDSTLLTILHQSNTSGLQIFRAETGWVTVPPINGTLVVNIGDLLHILSNGCYPSVLHRVLVNPTQHRFSMAYLYGPPNTAKISAPSKLVDNQHPSLYMPVTWREYLGIKAKHFNQALSMIRL